MSEETLGEETTAAAAQRYQGRNDPDRNEADRFSLNGKPLPFDEFVRAVMEGLPPREPVPAEPQPAPPPFPVAWAARRPLP